MTYKRFIYSRRRRRRIKGVLFFISLNPLSIECIRGRNIYIPICIFRRTCTRLDSEKFTIIIIIIIIIVIIIANSMAYGTNVAFTWALQ
jgi:hypothetical protein